MRYGVYFFVILTAIASIGFNAYFGYTIGKHSGEFFGIHNGYVYPFVFAVVDVIKIAIPVMLAVILFSSVPKVWKGAASLIGVALFLGMTAVSLSGIFGSFATDRDNMSAQRAAEAKQYNDLTTEKQAILAGNPYRQIRSPEAIQADIEAYKAAPDSRWNPTNGCNPESITITQSQMWCKEYHRLVGQREDAEKVLADRDRLAEINAALASMPGAIEADPQARRMGDMLGITPDQYVTSLITVLAFLIEFTASLMPVVIYVYGRAKEPIPDIGTDPDPEPGNAISLDDVRRMIDDAHHKRISPPELDCPVETAIERHRGRNEISYPELSETIANVCQERGETPLSARAIGLRVRELGYDVWQEPTDSGKVTVYGLGGARTELAEAA